MEKKSKSLPLHDGITLQNVRRTFHLPFKLAAKSLQIEPQLLSHFCKLYDIYDWPYREYKIISWKSKKKGYYSHYERGNDSIFDF